MSDEVILEEAFLNEERSPILVVSQDQIAHNMAKAKELLSEFEDCKFLFKMSPWSS